MRPRKQDSDNWLVSSAADPSLILLHTRAAVIMSSALGKIITGSGAGGCVRTSTLCVLDGGSNTVQAEPGPRQNLGPGRTRAGSLFTHLMEEVGVE